MPDNFSSSPIEPTDAARILKQEQAEGKEISLAQEMSELSMSSLADEAFNPVAMARSGRFTNLEDKCRKRGREETQKSEQPVVERVKEISDQYEQKNPELQARTLRILRDRISIDDTEEEILRKVLEVYPDPALADEAFEYLAETSSGALLERIRRAKESLNNTFAREIRAGRNIGEQARSFSNQGLGTPTGLRDLYRDITGNPREVTTLFSELSDKFSYDKMETAINFLLHSMGTDLKSKGPSIGRAELHRLMTEVRNLLAILWVYRFFRGRMDLVKASFERAGMLLPTRITFEMLAKLFIAMLKERYPSMEKVLQIALKLGLSSDLIAQIIIYTQMRDAVRGTAPKLFRTPQHRHDVLMSFIEAIEELEERADEEEEKKEKEQKKKEEEEEEK